MSSSLPADAVFCENSVARTTEDKQVRAKQTFEEMMKYLPGQFVVVVVQSRYSYPKYLLDYHSKVT